jgi:sugar-specific transcriptional regulator TrmB
MKHQSDFIRTQSEENDLWKFILRDSGFNKQTIMLEEALARFGLSENEVRIYVYLERTGEKKATEIAEALSFHRTDIYRILSALEEKGLVSSSFEKPLKFVAIPLDKAVDLLIKTQKMRISLLEKEKVNVINLWLSIPKEKVQNSKKNVFQILEGEPQVFSKVNELLERTHTELLVFAPEEYLNKLVNNDFLENLELCSQRLCVNLLTESSPKGEFFLSRINGTISKGMYDVESIGKLPCFIVSDKQELLTVFYNQDEAKERSQGKKIRLVGHFTNCTAYVQAMLMLFSRLAETGMS